MNFHRLAYPAIFATSMLWPALAQAAPADEVKDLLEAGKPSEAYTAAKKTPDEIGKPAFDFYFGIAAIDAGHVGEGVLALERYLLTFPDNFSARQQLARGYFMLGENARAREEFTSLRNSSPPPEVLAAIDRYLDAIRAREARYSLTSGFYVEFGIGHDSNVNAAPASGSVFVPGFGAQRLAPGSQKVATSFASLGAGGFVNYPVRPDLALFGQVQAEGNRHAKRETDHFELGNYSLTGGVAVLRDKQQFRFAISEGLVTVGRDSFRRATSGSAEWQRQFDNNQAVTVVVQLARFSYLSTRASEEGVPPNDNSPRDADYQGISASYKRALAGGWKPVVAIGVNAGKQHSRTGHPELVPRTAGVNLSAGFAPMTDWDFLVGFAWQRSDYGGPDFFAQPEARHDRYSVATAAATYHYSKNISVKGEALVSRNRSNADAYAFPRNLVSLKLRYEFK